MVNIIRRSSAYGEYDAYDKFYKIDLLTKIATSVSFLKLDSLTYCYLINYCLVEG